MNKIHEFFMNNSSNFRRGLARIVDLACNLVRILDCDFIVELLADSNLYKTIVGSRILLQFWADRICIPLYTPPPLIKKCYKYSEHASINDFLKVQHNNILLGIFMTQ